MAVPAAASSPLPGPDPHGRERDVFLRVLALVFLVAFVSLWVQVDGLVGAHGILPAGDLLRRMASAGPLRFWGLPTLLWAWPSDGGLHALCAGGTLLSVIALVRPRSIVYFGLWVFYLSLAVVTRLFLGFQWDALLLECGLLAVVLAPRGIRRLRPGATPVIVVWLLRWLLFRLMFGSGVVKLLSGDPTWRDLTALLFHYETQPLPTWIGWWAHQLPASFHLLSVAAMFVIELVLPFLIAVPALRRIPLAGFLFLQLLIGLTGNYAFFNVLAAALCVFLLPARGPRDLFGPWPRWFLGPLAAVLILVSGAQFVGGTLGLAWPWPSPVLALAQAISPLRSINNYGLFAVMTTTRPEIVLEGSDDGQTWRPYGFRYKPGDVGKRPGFVEPHQPRLDWQMWFAALGTCEDSPWLDRLMTRLLEGSPPVLGLLAENPFPGRPPRMVRAVLYDYHFTDPAALRRTGAWWRREWRGEFCPPRGLEATP